MLSIPDWLQRLGRITGYRQLQQALDEIIALAGSGRDQAELARAIDEAVGRLVAERAQDQQELQEVRARYESFRAQHQGVVGWFKRHIPFSATRRQEHEHRDSLAQQTAEVLADNLVIARAQMVKERFLGRDQRRLGETTAGWRAALDAAAAEGQLAPLGQVLQQLRSQQDLARGFLDALRADIEAFAGAQFADAEDRRQRDADLAAARGELAALVGEVDEKQALWQTGLKQLAARAAAELEAGDASFRADGQRLLQLNEAQRRVAEAQQTAEKLGAAAAALGKLASELKVLPAQVQQARDELRRLDGRCAAARREQADKQSALDALRTRLDAAQREADQARGVLAGAEQVYRAWQAQCRASQSMPVAAEAGGAGDRAVEQKYQEAQAAAETAAARLREAAAPWEAASKAADAARAALDGLHAQWTSQRDKLQALESRGPHLRGELLAAADAVQAAFAAAAAALAACLAGPRAAAAAPFHPHELAAGVDGGFAAQGFQRGLADALTQVERDYQRHLQAAEAVKRVGQWLQGQSQAVAAEQAAARGRRTAAWQRRLSEVLGQDLAQEACAGGLPA